jgi:hypothetical protein
MNKLLLILLVSGLAAFSAIADSGECQPCDKGDWSVERGFAAVCDLLIVRPLGTAATIGGFGVFAVASPFAAMVDSTDEIFDTLVKNPTDYTFNRDLGDFSK